MSAIANTRAVLASQVTNGNTVAIVYPSGFTKADLVGTVGGKLALGNNDVFPQAAAGAGTVAFAFGASTITITNNTGVTWPAQSEITVSFGKTDRNGSYNLTIGTERGQAAPGDVTGASVQTLTASGAVLSATDVLEVAHASVVIAATLDVAGKRGLFIVRNTSASGTAAHTVTLTNGTWNGTNTIATLDAPGEALVVFFDELGRGQIVTNTGSVGLS